LSNAANNYILENATKSDTSVRNGENLSTIEGRKYDNVLSEIETLPKIL